MGGLGGPVRRLSTLLSNLSGVRRVLIKPQSELLDQAMRGAGSVDEHISVRRSAQRSYLGSLVLMVKIFARTSSRMRPIDVIHANGIVEFALSWPPALLLRKPIVTWVGNYEPPAFVKRFRPLFGTVARRTRWNAVSTTAASVIADCGLASRADIKIVTNIVDPADMVPTRVATGDRDAKQLRIGYLQVAKKVKGFDLLPRVIQELSDVHDRVKFLIYTRRNDEQAWVDLDELPPDVVEIRPRTADVGNIYAECDIVFSPSRAESFNRVAAEALTTGTPLVASDLAPVREVAGEAGLFFPVEDVIAAADCLRRLINDADLRACLSRIGRARSQSWLPGPVAAEFASQYRSLTEPRSRERSWIREKIRKGGYFTTSGRPN